MFSAELLRRLECASAVCVLTGAGVSAESGIATFRDPDGLWMKMKPEELASIDAFMRNPDLVWEWYAQRRRVASDVAPNPGHFALADLETLYADFTLATQNVDNLHRRAGSANVLELHGNIERCFCMDCRAAYAAADFPASPSVPRCAVCGGLVRPDVVWFGEMLPQREVREAWAAAERCDVLLSVGTSGEVYPAAQLPLVAREAGAWVVEINPRRSSIARHMHECVEAASGTALPALVDAVARARLSA